MGTGKHSVASGRRKGVDTGVQRCWEVPTAPGPPDCPEPRLRVGTLQKHFAKSHAREQHAVQARAETPSRHNPELQAGICSHAPNVTFRAGECHTAFHTRAEALV